MEFVSTWQNPEGLPDLKVTHANHTGRLIILRGVTGEPVGGQLFNVGLAQALGLHLAQPLGQVEEGLVVLGLVDVGPGHAGLEVGAREHGEDAQEETGRVWGGVEHAGGGCRLKGNGQARGRHLMLQGLGLRGRSGHGHALAHSGRGLGRCWPVAPTSSRRDDPPVVGAGVSQPVTRRRG